MDSNGPARILELTMAFYSSRALVTAVELDVFSKLSEGSVELAEAPQRLGLHPRGARDFLDTLVALKLIERHGSTYRNNAEGEEYLVRGRPTFVGGYAHMANRFLFPLWSKLTEAVRTGEPQVPASGGMFGGFQDPAAARSFMGAMDAVNGKVGADLAVHLDWGRYSTFVDVGGARGNVAATVIGKHPHLTGVVFDLPQIEPLFQEHVEALGFADRISYAAGDFFQNPLPTGDVMILGHILHYFGDDEIAQLLKSVYDALTPGGAIIVYDRMIDEGRCARPLSLLGSLNMLLTSTGGREFTPSTCFSWLEGAGFSSFSATSVGDLDTMVVARRD